jgi:hypothetical protein
VAISARRPLPRIARIAAELLAEQIRACLFQVRSRQSARRAAAD